MTHRAYPIGPDPLTCYAGALDECARLRREIETQRRQLAHYRAAADTHAAFMLRLRQLFPAAASRVAADLAVDAALDLRRRVDG